MEKNPYDHIKPVSDPDLFFGRVAELQRATEIICKAACLSLVGGPHCGLTSLLHHLQSSGFVNRCEESAGGLRFVYLDCAECNDPLEIILYLLQEINPRRRVPNRGPGWRSLQGTLISTLSHTRQNDTRVVLLMDNFEPLGAKEGAVEFLESLRGLSQRIEMTMITATRTELKNCCHQDVVSSPFPNIFQVEYVEAWRADETAQFVSATSEESGVDLTPHTKRVSDWSGGIPSLAQILCAQLFEVVCGGGQVDWDALHQAASETATGFLDDIWRHFTDDERELIVAGAKGDVQGDIPGSLLGKGYFMDGRLASRALAEYAKSHG